MHRSSIGDRFVQALRGQLDGSPRVKVTALAACLGAVSLTRLASARDDSTSEPAQPRPTVVAQSTTTLRLFERALLPGPGGALVRTHTLLPVHEYLSLRVYGLHSGLSAAPASAELSGWLGVTFGPREGEPPAVGDVASAWVRQPLGVFELTLGRQATFGGAARYARFDGAELSVRGELGEGWSAGAGAYAGFSVLPRWDARPGYFHLGAAADSLVRDPSALPDAERAGNRMFGARAHAAWGERTFAGLSFHEEHQQSELARRQLGLDVRLEPIRELAFTGNLISDVESLEIADARAWLEFEPEERWLLQLEGAHADPRLFLSHQSVLSVFDTSAYDELGVEVGHRPLRHVSLSSSVFAQWFGEGDVGARGVARVQMDVDRSRSTWLGATYSRVVVPEGGYHMLGQSLRRLLSQRLVTSAQAYFYWYDRAIEQRRSSSVYSGNLAWTLNPALELMWGASLAQTPYAARDLQTLLRLRYEANSIGAAR